LKVTTYVFVLDIVELNNDDNSGGSSNTLCNTSHILT